MACARFPRESACVCVCVCLRASACTCLQSFSGCQKKSSTQKSKPQHFIATGISGILIHQFHGPKDRFTMLNQPLLSPPPPLRSGRQPEKGVHEEKPVGTTFYLLLGLYIVGLCTTIMWLPHDVHADESHYFAMAAAIIFGVSGFVIVIWWLMGDQLMECWGGPSKPHKS
jgi:hypothetical protein